MATIDAARVLGDLRHLRTLGAYKTGVHRPSLSPEHVQSLRWLVGELTAIGHSAQIDGIGNVLGFGAVKGCRILAGSHLESQNQAGWLDGPLGVVYALEAARAVKADPALSDCAIDVGAWCDEEGHFGSFLGSRSAVGEVADAEIDQAVDRTLGITMRDALRNAGLADLPRQSIDPARYIGYFEAHIEQGDWLEAGGQKIGIVSSIVGITQLRISFEGTQNHAGTTRMAIRRDAGLAAARLAVAIDERFPGLSGPRTVWTVGNIAFDPGSPSIIPGKAQMLFQFRDTDLAVHQRLEAEVRRLVEDANRSGLCVATIEKLRQTRPAVMAESFQSAIETATKTHCPGGHVRMPSGAGHDAQIFANHMPSAMLFVPSIGGISHHWTENTSDDDIVLGAKVFLDAAVDLLKA